jgi:predicted enzyme related to lactoylglutathione lyase
MDESIAFYQALGVPLEVNDHGGGKHAEAEFGDVHFAIWPPRGPVGAGEGSSISFCFHVPNLEAYCRELEAKGLPFLHGPMELPFGGVIASLRDPDGNKVTLMRWQSE